MTGVGDAPGPAPVDAVHHAVSQRADDGPPLLDLALEAKGVNELAGLDIGGWKRAGGQVEHEAVVVHRHAAPARAGSRLVHADPVARTMEPPGRRQPGRAAAHDGDGAGTEVGHTRDGWRSIDATPATSGDATAATGGSTGSPRVTHHTNRAANANTATAAGYVAQNPSGC